MLKTNHKFILHGSTIPVSWNYDNSEHRSLYIWHKKSFWPWRNYTSISATGETSFRVNQNPFIVEIRQLTILGFKTISTLELPVNSLKTKGLETEINARFGISLDQFHSETTKKSSILIRNAKLNSEISAPQIHVIGIDPAEIKELEYNNEILNYTN
jgi:hypothetical protein